MLLLETFNGSTAAIGGHVDPIGFLSSIQENVGSYATGAYLNDGIHVIDGFVNRVGFLADGQVIGGGCLW